MSADIQLYCPQVEHLGSFICQRVGYRVKHNTCCWDNRIIAHTTADVPYSIFDNILCVGTIYMEAAEQEMCREAMQLHKIKTNPLTYIVHLAGKVNWPQEETDAADVQAYNSTRCTIGSNVLRMYKQEGVEGKDKWVSETQFRRKQGAQIWMFDVFTNMNTSTKWPTRTNCYEDRG